MSELFGFIFISVMVFLFIWNDYHTRKSLKDLRRMHEQYMKETEDSHQEFLMDVKRAMEKK